MRIAPFLTLILIQNVVKKIKVWAQKDLEDAEDLSTSFIWTDKIHFLQIGSNYCRSIYYKFCVDSRKLKARILIGIYHMSRYKYITFLYTYLCNFASISMTNAATATKRRNIFPADWNCNNQEDLRSVITPFWIAIETKRSQSLAFPPTLLTRI